MGDPDTGMTFEYLREVYRREKSSTQLWDGVRADLYVATAELFKAQRMECDEELRKDPESIRSENVSNLIIRTKRLFKDIVNIRMDKICKMALRGADRADNKVDSLTKEEKEYYDKILLASQEHSSVINRLCGSASYRIPDVSAPPVKPVAPARQVIPEPEPIMDDSDEEPLNGSMEVQIDTVPEDGIVMIDHNPDLDEPDVDMEIPDDALDSAMQKGFSAPSEKPAEPQIPEPEQKTEDGKLMLVRILADLPTIAGPDRNYDLRKEDLVRLPELFANVLLNRNLALKVSISP